MLRPKDINRQTDSGIGVSVPPLLLLKERRGKKNKTRTGNIRKIIPFAAKSDFQNQVQSTMSVANSNDDDCSRGSVEEKVPVLMQIHVHGKQKSPHISPTSSEDFMEDQHDKENYKKSNNNNRNKTSGLLTGTINYFDPGENWLKLVDRDQESQGRSVLDETQDEFLASQYKKVPFPQSLRARDMDDDTVPSDQCFLVVDVDNSCGRVQLAVKDMRRFDKGDIEDQMWELCLARRLSKPGSKKENKPSISQQSNGDHPWAGYSQLEVLPRRQLRILQLGDRLCTRFRNMGTESDTENDDDNLQDVSKAVGLVLEYRMELPLKSNGKEGQQPRQLDENESENGENDFVTQIQTQQDEEEIDGNELRVESMIQVNDNDDEEEPGTQEEIILLGQTIESESEETNDSKGKGESDEAQRRDADAHDKLTNADAIEPLMTQPSGDDSDSDTTAGRDDDEDQPLEKMRDGGNADTSKVDSRSLETKDLWEPGIQRSANDKVTNEKDAGSTKAGLDEKSAQKNKEENTDDDDATTVGSLVNAEKMDVSKIDTEKETSVDVDSQETALESQRAVDSQATELEQSPEKSTENAQSTLLKKTAKGKSENVAHNVNRNSPETPTRSKNNNESGDIERPWLSDSEKKRRKARRTYGSRDRSSASSRSYSKSSQSPSASGEKQAEDSDNPAAKRDDLKSMEGSGGSTEKQHQQKKEGDDKALNDEPPNSDKNDDNRKLPEKDGTTPSNEGGKSSQEKNSEKQQDHSVAASPSSVKNKESPTSRQRRSLIRKKKQDSPATDQKDEGIEDGEDQDVDALDPFDFMESQIGPPRAKKISDPKVGKRKSKRKRGNDDETSYGADQEGEKDQIPLSIVTTSSTSDEKVTNKARKRRKKANLEENDLPDLTKDSNSRKDAPLSTSEDSPTVDDYDDKKTKLETSSPMKSSQAGSETQKNTVATALLELEGGSDVANVTSKEAATSPMASPQITDSQGAVKALMGIRDSTGSNELDPYMKKFANEDGVVGDDKPEPSFDTTSKVHADKAMEKLDEGQPPETSTEETQDSPLKNNPSKPTGRTRAIRHKKNEKQTLETYAKGGDSEPSKQPAATTRKGRGKKKQDSSKESTKSTPTATKDQDDTDAATPPPTGRGKRKQKAKPTETPATNRKRRAANTTTDKIETKLARSTRAKADRSDSGSDDGSDNEEVNITTTGITLTKAQENIVARIGGKLLNDTMDSLHATHIIAGDKKTSMKRTTKLMVGLCNAGKIISREWLVDSGKAKKALPVEDYLLLNDKQAEKRYQFKMTDSLQRAKEMLAEGQKVLSGYSIHACKGVAGNKAPPTAEMKLIVEQAGGIWTPALTKKALSGVDMEKMLVITSDPEGNGQITAKPVASALESGAKKLTTSAFFNTIMKQEIDF